MQVFFTARRPLRHPTTQRQSTEREREREAVAVTAVVVFEVGGARVTANRTQHIAITLRHRVTVGRLVSTRTL